MNIASKKAIIEIREMVPVFLLFVLAGFIIYGVSLKGEFLWDDYFLVKDNVYIRNWSNMADIFTKDIGAGGAGKFNYYRPVQLLTYVIDYSLWKSNVTGFHVTNVLLHALVALSMYGLFRMLFNDKSLSLCASVFFLIHPVHTEAISYISGRAEPLSALFIVLAMIFYIKFLDTKRVSSYCVMLISFALALLSKEYSLIFPAFLLLYHATFKKAFNARAFLSIICFCAIYLVLRSVVIKNILPEIIGKTYIFDRIPGIFVALAAYTRLLIAPFGLHMEYGDKLFSVYDPKAIAGAIIAVLAVSIAIRNRQSNKVIFFSIIWFFLAFLPVSNIFPAGAFMAEHWLYMPSMGFFLITAYFVAKFLRSKKSRGLTVIVLVFAIPFYSISSVKQNSYWRDPVTLYNRIIHLAPDSARAYINLARLYQVRGNNRQAIALAKKAIALQPNNPVAYSKLGLAFAELGMKEEAVESFKRALEIAPDFIEAYNNLANLYGSMGRDKEAVGLLNKAADINPDFSMGYYNNALIYHNKGDFQNAAELYLKAIDADPNLGPAYINLGVIYHKMGKIGQSMDLLKRAIEIDPGEAEAHYDLGLVYYDIKDYQNAINCYKKTIELNKNHTKAYKNLGSAYLAAGLYEEAVGALEQAVILDPDDINNYSRTGFAYYNLGKIDEAIEEYKKAIAVDPDYARGYNDIAAIYYEQDQFDLAIEYCDKAIGLGHADPALVKALEPYRNK